MKNNVFLTLISVFVPFSFLSIGGGSSIIPGIQHETVAVQGWLTPQEFVNLFAVARAAPGPGMMLSTLIGWKIAGWLGAVVATLALMGPSALFCYAVVKLTNTHREKKWHRAFREGLAPVGIGLTVAGSIMILQLSGGGIWAAAIAALSTAIMLAYPNVSVLGLLIMAGLVNTAAHMLG